MNLNLYEDSTHSFVIKIWLEQAVEETDKAVLRGHVTHVMSGKKHYVKNLDEITEFIFIYFKDLGVKISPFCKIKLWLKRLKW